MQLVEGRGKGMRPAPRMVWGLVIVTSGVLLLNASTGAATTEATPTEVLETEIEDLYSPEPIDTPEPGEHFDGPLIYEGPDPSRDPVVEAWLNS